MTTPDLGSIRAFGEVKTCGEWSRDPRCPVPRRTLRHRLLRGWDAERAITTGARVINLDLIEYKGEAKSLREWSEQLGIPYQTLHKRVRTHGMTLDEAIAASFSGAVRDASA